MQKYKNSEGSDTLYIKINHRCYKNSLGQNKRYKKCIIITFFCELQLITVLLLIHNSYTCWTTRLISLKLWVAFPTFDSVSLLLKFIFLFNKKTWTLWVWNFPIPFIIKIIQKLHSFALRPLIFTLQKEVWKLNDICVSRSSPKTDLVTNFLKLENRSFE